MLGMLLFCLYFQSLYLALSLSSSPFKNLRLSTPYNYMLKIIRRDPSRYAKVPLHNIGMSRTKLVAVVRTHGPAVGKYLVQHGFQPRDCDFQNVRWNVCLANNEPPYLFIRRGVIGGRHLFSRARALTWMYLFLVDQGNAATAEPPTNQVEIHALGGGPFLLVSALCW